MHLPQGRTQGPGNHGTQSSERDIGMQAVNRAQEPTVAGGILEIHAQLADEYDAHGHRRRPSVHHARHIGHLGFTQCNIVLPTGPPSPPGPPFPIRVPDGVEGNARPVNETHDSALVARATPGDTQQSVHPRTRQCPGVGYACDVVIRYNRVPST